MNIPAGILAEGPEEKTWVHGRRVMELPAHLKSSDELYAELLGTLDLIGQWMGGCKETLNEEFYRDTLRCLLAGLDDTITTIHTRLRTGQWKRQD